MKKVRPMLGSLNRQLNHAVRFLEKASWGVRDAGLEPKRNLRKIGRAPAHIFEVQGEIYRQRPDLLPKFLYHTALGREVLSNHAVKRNARQKRPRAPYRKR